MKSNGKLIGNLLLLALLFTAGCSGINSSYSVSPASFFLPGLMQNQPPVTATDGLLASTN